MESRVNYTLVGFFVLLLGAIGIIIPLWLSSGLDQQQYNTYLIYMNEAVDGLSTNAAVSYNGVSVGYVKAIKLNPTNPSQVELFVSIKEGTSITTNTTATLRSQGITGVAYIGLSGGTLRGAQPLAVKPGARFPVIKAAPSLMVRLDSALTDLMNTITHLSKQLDGVMSPENEKLFNSILKNTSDMTHNFSVQSGKTDQIILSLNTLIQHADQSAQHFPRMTIQLQQLLTNLQTLSTDLKQNPGMLVRGKALPPLGPGEK
jgi:phospholipid/cholesterol/gamma-HCH transport system substrate-binding protein